MNFQTTSGVFDAPTQQHSGPEIHTSPPVHRKLPALPAAPADVICYGVLVIEAILLFLFAEELFYGIVLPGIRLLLDISGFLIIVIAIVAAVSTGCKKIFHRFRRWF